jgi:hypothetical protein
MNKRPCEATQLKMNKRPCEATQPQTITIFLGAHGLESDTYPGRPKTRSLNPHRYLRDFKVNFLSFAGYANIKTEAGILYKKKDENEQLERMTKIYSLKSTLITIETAEQLYGLGTDHVTLSYLVPRIFSGKEITSQAVSISVIDDMKKEMKAVGILADIEYSKTSTPEKTENPHFEKWWWFDNNPGDDRRRFETQERTGISRAAGNTEDNPILSTNGLFILHTTNEDHKPFSISDIHDATDYEVANETYSGPSSPLTIITPVAIKRRNLLRKINYTSYWKKWIEASDFSEVPDEDVLEIGSIDEAVFIVTQIYYAFLHDATDNPAELVSLPKIHEEKYVNEGDGTEILVAEGPESPPLLLSQFIKNRLKAIIDPRTVKSSELRGLSEDANKNVQTIRDTFLEKANAADALEKRIEQIKQEQMVTRQTSETLKEMERQLANADEQLDDTRVDLTAAKNKSAELESKLEVLKIEIIADVTKFIRALISQWNQDVKAVIKNIIMRNKLKNILKFGIFHKRLSLSQIILFFRSLGYNIINIVDPSCFVLKAPRSFQTDQHTQDVDDSQQGMKFEPKLPPPLTWNKQLDVLTPLLTTRSSRAGGTKRKRSYSRKRRTRKKRCVTRRYRRSRRRN